MKITSIMISKKCGIPLPTVRRLSSELIPDKNLQASGKAKTFTFGEALAIYVAYHLVSVLNYSKE